MKKRFLPFVFVPMVLAVAACGGKGEGTETSTGTTSTGTTSSETSVAPSSEETIDNQQDVDNLKSLLAKQDLSPFNEKVFFSTYQQNFSVYSNAIDDDGKYIEFINYSGSGNLGYYYNVDAETYAEIIKDKDINIFDIMCQGYGFYVLTQYATVNSFLNDEFEEAEARERFSFIQELTAQFDATNLQIDNFYMYADYFNDENMDIRSFSGIIDKGILFESYTTKALSDVFSRVNLYDGPGYCEAIDALYYQICLALVGSSDKEISDFIHNNNVGYAESNQYLELSFELKEEKYIEQLIESEVIPGTIKGTLFFDKETQKLDDFKYKIIHFEEAADYDTNCIHTASMEFKVEGNFRRGKPEGELPVGEEPTVYTDANEFMGQVIEQVIPPIAQ